MDHVSGKTWVRTYFPPLYEATARFMHWPYFSSGCERAYAAKCFSHGLAERERRPERERERRPERDLPPERERRPERDLRPERERDLRDFLRAERERDLRPERERDLRDFLRAERERERLEPLDFLLPLRLRRLGLRRPPVSSSFFKYGSCPSRPP